MNILISDLMRPGIKFSCQLGNKGKRFNWEVIRKMEPDDIEDINGSKVTNVLNNKWWCRKLPKGKPVLCCFNPIVSKDEIMRMHLRW